MSEPALVLASASPRRLQLLRALGLPFTTMVSNIDERALSASYRGQPHDLALWLAERKARAVAAADRAAHRLILAADTTVIFQGRELGKPKDVADAVAMLRSLRGQQHEVITGLVLLPTHTEQMLRTQARTVVTMRPYSDADIAAYVASGDPLDKAGSYAIQHPEFQPVAHIAGCYPNVMGLPICLVALLLCRIGVALPPGPNMGLCGWYLSCTPPLPEVLR
jgi:septum formation protein